MEPSGRAPAWNRLVVAADSQPIRGPSSTSSPPIFQPPLMLPQKNIPSESKQVLLYRSLLFYFFFLFSSSSSLVFFRPDCSVALTIESQGLRPVASRLLGLRGRPLFDFEGSVLRCLAPGAFFLCFSPPVTPTIASSGCTAANPRSTIRRTSTTTKRGARLLESEKTPEAVYGFTGRSIYHWAHLNAKPPRAKACTVLSIYFCFVLRPLPCVHTGLTPFRPLTIICYNFFLFFSAPISTHSFRLAPGFPSP